MTSIRSFINQVILKSTFITVVSGLPRSGTSMMMSALSAGGMDLLVDGFRQADDNNPKGYYELELVKKLPEGNHAWLKSAQGKAVKIITGLLNHLPDHFQYRILFMEREIDEILDSQKRMLKRLNKPGKEPVGDDEMRRYYAEHLEDVNLWLAKKSWIRTLHISYNAILESPRENFLAVAAFLNNKVDPDQMQQVVDYSLYRTRK